MFKCKYCEKQFNSQDGLRKHVSRGDKKTHPQYIQYVIQTLQQRGFSIEKIRQMYQVEGKSSIDIMNILNIPKVLVLKIMHRNSFVFRDMSQARSFSAKIHGVWNRGKKKNQHPSIMKYSISRRGKNNPYFKQQGFEQRRQKLLQASARGRAKSMLSSSRTAKTTQIPIQTILKNKGIFFLKNYSVKYRLGQNNSWYLYDFYIPQFNLIIQTNGDYWHCNPDRYKWNDQVRVKGFKYAKQVWDYDLRKKNTAQEKGYGVLVLWQNQIQNTSVEDIFERIKNAARRN